MKTFFALFGILAIQLFLLINLQFTAWPEMLSYPYLYNNGFSLYKDLAYPYPPILTLYLALAYKLFGYSLIVLKVISWKIILSSTILVFLLAKKLSGRLTNAILLTTIYIFLQPFLEGNMLWFDIAIVPLVLLGILFSLLYFEMNRNLFLFLASFFFSIATFTKQTAGVFIILFLLVLIFKKTNIKKLAIVAFTPLLFLFPMFVTLLQDNSLLDFLNWTIIYPSTLWSHFPGYVQMNLSFRQLSILSLLILPVFVFVLKTGELKNFKTNYLIAFFIVSAFIVYPRFSFFHFQLALSILILLAALVTKNLSFNKLLPMCCAISLLFAIIFYNDIGLYWRKEARFYSHEEISQAEKIDKIVPKEDKIFLLGINSNEYVLANRLPPTRWVDNYIWYFEIPGVQEEMLRRWSLDPPIYVLRKIPKEGNWFDLGTYQPKQVLSYIYKYYTKTETDDNVEVWRKNK